MVLSKIKIQNYRLLVDSEIELHNNTTLIVGRNNTAKTSFIDCIRTVLTGGKFSYNDYSLNKRIELHRLIESFILGELTFSEVCEKIPVINIELTVDYTLDDPECNLGALSPFIIDVDVDITQAIIKIENKLKIDERLLRELFHDCFYNNDLKLSTPNIDELRNILKQQFIKIFEITIYAINPHNPDDKQLKSIKELSVLFPIHYIPAERTLGEDGSNNNTLNSLISSYFDVEEKDIDPKVSDEVIKLRQTVEAANKSIQDNSDKLLSSIVNKAVGFGYPNAEELQLGVTTQLKIDDQIKNNTTLAYIFNNTHEKLPSSHNGLGYKNLIKIEFLLATFAKSVEIYCNTCIPLLFIEEPESHMHPQMQQTFADYLEKFLSKIANVHIQTILTSHSAHIANTMDFSKIRYAQKSVNGVVYKNLNTFAASNDENVDFIKKYLTLSRCDIFFADKIIFVEGASERILLPDIISKCDQNGDFNTQKYKLPAQYYSLIEIGGAYAYKFIPFVEFLEVPCLIITDIDSMLDGRTKEVVSKGKTTSNSTIKWWYKKINNIPPDDKQTIQLSDIIAMSSENKTINKCHLEFQTNEIGLCGRSLEEAIMNVNRAHYNLTGVVTEESLEFKGKCKTDFALDLICNCPNYQTPHYIVDGLKWLNDQKVLE